MNYKLQLALDAQASESYAEAFMLLLDCLESAVNTQDAAVMANSLLAFADSVLEWCLAAVDPFEARELAAKDALKIFREIGDREGEARALLVMASVDHCQTVEMDRAALEIGRQIGNDAIIARALAHLGNESLLYGRKAEATQLVAEALAYAEKSGEPELIADTIFILGTAQDGRASVEAFERFASFQDRYGRKRRFVRRLSTAASLISEDDPRRAEEWLNRCISIGRDLAEPRIEGDAIRGLAEIEQARGKQLKADELHALANVMCPVPDTTELIKAIEKAIDTHEFGAVGEAMRSMIRKTK